MAGSTDQSSVFPESDVLMKDNTYLDYINDILMDEGMDDDAVWLQQADGTSSSSYDAIFCSLQAILAGSPPVSPNQYNDEAYLQHVEGTPNYQAIFSSLQDIIRTDSVPRSHHQSQIPQDENSPRMLSGVMQQLHAEDENLRSNLCRSVDCDVEDVMPRGNESNHELLSVVAAKSLKGPQKQRNDASEPPTLTDQIAGLEVSFEELKLHEVYTSLYVDGPSSSSTNGRPKPNYTTTHMGKVCEKHTSKEPVFADVRGVLISCAEAVAEGNVTRATQILQEIHQTCGASADGTGLQRIAYIFSRALAARMRGMGVQEYEAICRNMPSSAAILKATRLKFGVIPYKTLIHYYASQSIVKAAEGASRLHIVDYGVTGYGLQWPCLINALADCKGVSPLLVITFIGLPQPGVDMARRLDETGQRLAAYAKTYNVPFEYHAIVSDKWADLDAASLLHCSSPPEVLIINCATCLRYVADDTLTLGNSTTSARQKLLTIWHSLNPHLLVTTVLNGAQNSPFFVSRFREALDFNTNGFEMLETLYIGIPERLIVERAYYYHTIMNVVACEGVDRVERSESYKHWHARITKAGFVQTPIPSAILVTSKSHLKQHYHKDFFIDDDKNGWMLMGWKGRAVLAASAWKPAQRVL